MTVQEHFDLVILGAGPAGSRAALAARTAGLRCALVEGGFLGGACLNVGCIPTKYLLGGTAALPLFQAQRKYKVASGEPRIDLAALQARKERFVKASRQALEKRLTEAGVTLFHGRGTFVSPNALALKQGDADLRLGFGKCIVATGSVPARFPSLKPDGASVMTSTGVLSLTSAPKRLLVVGAGAIGLELGELFHRLGSSIILVEALDRIAPSEEPEISAALAAHCKREGWQVHLGRRIASLVTTDGVARLRFEDGEELAADVALLAIGRRSAAGALGVDEAGIALDAKGWIATDEYLRCGEHIYAVGDCNGRTLLAHAAEHQAAYAVAHAVGTATDPYSHPAMPACIYGTFEVMRVGPTLAALQKQGGALGVSQVPLAVNAIAQSFGHPQGLAHMVWKDGVLASVSVAGHGASHLVSAAALLIASGIEKNRGKPIIFAHPTLDEVLESAMVAPMKNVP